MMQRIHGSVAKLVNDLFAVRILPFWRTKGNKDYFDGCLRDTFQLKHAWRYAMLQAVRAGIVMDYRDYPHTRILVPYEQALEFAVEHHALMEGVRYPRYEGMREVGDAFEKISSRLQSSPRSPTSAPDDGSSGGSLL